MASMGPKAPKSEH